MNYKIEKGIPVPKYRNGDIINVINQMEVGDSILVESRAKAASFVTAARRIGTKMTSTSVSDNEVRVWRVA